MLYKRPEEQGRRQEIRMSMKYRKQELLQAVGCVLCAALAWKYQIDLDGPELSGGRLTGPLLTMNGVGSILFVLAFPLAFLHSRAAAACALIASALCMPLYAYLAAPRLFRQAFPGEYSVPLIAFGWDAWSIASILAISLLVYACYRTLFSR